MSGTLYLDFHVLQTVPPSNLNRDDNGTPKHATYGGVRRARVSSQAWKRATRTAFADAQPTDTLGVRTKRITKVLTERIQARTELEGESAAKLAAALYEEFGVKADKKKAGESAYLLFFGRNQLDQIVSLIADRAGELAQLSADELKNQLKDLPVADQLKQAHPIDVALFGRMVADIPTLNVDAAVQVAHALSTHPVEIEFDYFTAVDDENTDDSGAGMIGTVEFNSATLYRYATLAIHLLAENLDENDAVINAAAAFADAFIRSIPGGHGNTFAHRTLPHLAVVTARSDQPVNLVSAFEKPVYGTTNGIAAESALRLAEEHHAVARTWSLAQAPTTASYTLTDTKLADTFGPSAPLTDLITAVREHTAAFLATERAQ